jgi:hypothetical protein
MDYIIFLINVKREFLEKKQNSTERNGFIAVKQARFISRILRPEFTNSSSFSLALNFNDEVTDS